MTKQMEVEDHEVETTEVKKKHKKKEKKVAEMQDEETVESDASIEKKRKKKEKKEKKEKKRKSKEQSKEEEKEEEKKEEKPKKKEKRSREEPTEEAENGHKKHKQENGATHKNSTDVSKKPSFRKNFYQEHKSLANFTKEEVEKFRQERNMTVTGIDLKPVRTFEESTFSKEMLEVCKGFKTPTPIQSQCWPIILSGRDVIGIAETGSGKTIAFTLPALVHIKDQPNISKHSKGPIALILSPTRELAMQIGDVCTKAGQPIGVKSLCVYGGVPKPPQAQEAERGVHIIVATPGRLVDLMQDGSVSLDRVTYLVLDEADAMLDLGFEREIKFILSKIRTDRQTLMFSATWPKEIQQLAAQYFSDPVKVTIGSEDLAANHRVQQIVEVIEDRERDRRLVQLLNNYHQTRKNRIMVFVLYKKEAVRVEQMLQKRGFNVIALHGDKSQNDRTRSRDLFVSGTHPLLVATDVAARGLDFPNVEYVINYSFPLTIEDYVHRIGRTGRAGKTGVSHTFFMQSDKGKATELIDILKEANQPVPDDLDKMCTVRATKKKEHKLYGNAFKEISLTANKPTRITFDD